MRKSEKEITDQNELTYILKNTKICRLGFAENNAPYVVPMSYGFEDGSLYFHSAIEGRKIDIIKNNNRVCFEIDTDIDYVNNENACAWSTTYKSIIGYGRIEILTGIPEKRKGLLVIMQQHSGHMNWEISDKNVENVLVMKLPIEEMCGKKSI